MLCFMLQSLDPNTISDARILVLLLVSERRHCKDRRILNGIDTVYVVSFVIVMMKGKVYFLHESYSKWYVTLEINLLG